MSHLPDDVVADILSRLAVKPLLQFRCVSMRWRALIDSSDFVKLHLNRSIESKTDLYLIVRNDHLYAVDFDSFDAVKAVKFDHHSLSFHDYAIEVWGSCNGLLCLTTAFDTLVLWNPSTRKYRRLPYEVIELEKQSRFMEIRVYGFGYDSLSDDYKVVRIVIVKGDDVDFRYEVKVYSLKSNSWHRAEKFPQYPHHAHLKRLGGVLASGALHWVVPHETDPGSIVAFDLGSEKFRSVPEPEYEDSSCYIKVETLGGCLSVVCDYYLTRVDIWVMKEYGVKNSWTKLISMVKPGVITSFQYVRPVAYSKSGENILLEQEGLLKQDTKQLLWYELKTNKARNVKVCGAKDLFQVDMCSATLVSLKGDGKGDWKKQQDQEEKNMTDFLSKGFKLVL